MSTESLRHKYDVSPWKFPIEEMVSNSDKVSEVLGSGKC